jgi:putative ABC transport system permease protein
VIGVLPSEFQFARFSADIWEPATLSPDWNPEVRGTGPWFVVGRLRGGVSIESAQAELTVIAQRFNQNSTVTNFNSTISVVPLKRQLIGARAQSALWMLMAALTCLLLVAAANVAGLSLARGISRGQEIAIRGALGASRSRIVRQLLVESLTLSVVSGGFGLLVALCGMRVLQLLQPWHLDRLNHLRLDPIVLAWSMGVCLATGILVGIAPAMMIARRNILPSGAGSRGVSRGVAVSLFRRFLVVAQFALAAILLTGAGLLIRSLQSAENVDHGFRPERILSMQLSTAALSSTTQRAMFYDRLLQQIAAIPGVEQAGIIDDLFVGSGAEQVLSLDGDQGPTSNRIRFRRDAISDAFFRTLGTPMLRGRSFTTADRQGSPAVAIVNDTMARRVWPGSDPIGKKFRIGDGTSAVWFTVVGVVSNMRRQGPEKEPIPQMFEPLAQNPSRLMTLIVRTSNAEPLTMVTDLRSALYRVDSRAPLYGITTLEDRLGFFLTMRRFETSLLTWFSGVALLMAMVGIYGLIQYSISTRTQEIGIRVAIGAQTGQILRMVLNEGIKLSIAGISIGLIGVLALGRAASSLLFGVSATDPWTIASVCLLLCLAGMAACYFPARHVMKIDPISALRNAS